MSRILVLGPSSYNCVIVNNFGFLGAGQALGAISPTNKFRGVTITDVDCQSSANDYDLQFTFGADVPQNYFTSLFVQDGTGVVRKYDSSAAGFIPWNGIKTFWIYGTGSNPIYVPADAGKTRSLQILW